MNKQLVCDAIIQALQQDLIQIHQALQDSHAVSTDEANIPENKYDTLALEASYLEQGQARHAAELEDSIAAFSAMQLQAFGPGSCILLSALFSLIPENDSENSTQLFFFGPAAGGYSVTHEGQSITVITPGSPIGKAVLTRKAGDAVEFEVAGRQQRQIVGAIW